MLLYFYIIIFGIIYFSKYTFNINLRFVFKVLKSRICVRRQVAKCLGTYRFRGV